METVTLKRKLKDGSILQAIYAPHNGMNLMSLKKDKIEVIDESTKDLFEERSAGLGALIGPHFYHLKDELIPPPPPDDLFPHIPKTKAKGQKDLFSHGIGRYVPWKYQATETTISAKIASVDTYEGFLLSDLEGLNFYMTYDAEITEEGLRIKISSNSDLFSIIGLHYYFAMGPKSFLEADVQKEYNEGGIFKPIPPEWFHAQSLLHLNLNEETDFGFLPKWKNKEGVITLKNETYLLEITMTPLENSEASFQVYHPKDASFVCIEPMTAKNPRGSLPKQGSLQVDIKIIDLPNQSG